MNDHKLPGLKDSVLTRILLAPLKKAMYSYNFVSDFFENIDKYL